MNFITTIYDRAEKKLLLPCLGKSPQLNLSELEEKSLYIFVIAVVWERLNENEAFSYAPLARL